MLLYQLLEVLSHRFPAHVFVSFVLLRLLLSRLYSYWCSVSFMSPLHSGLVLPLSSTPYLVRLQTRELQSLLCLPLQASFLTAVLLLVYEIASSSSWQLLGPVACCCGWAALLLLQIPSSLICFLSFSLPPPSPIGCCCFAVLLFAIGISSFLACFLVLADCSFPSSFLGFLVAVPISFSPVFFFDWVLGSLPGYFIFLLLT